MPISFPHIAPVLMLHATHLHLTLAWSGHLNLRSSPRWLQGIVSWGIAIFEYCLAVPANRIGHQVYSAAELKTMQEVITLIVFAVFSVTFLGEKLTMNHAVGFALIIGGAWFIFRGPL